MNTPQLPILDGAAVTLRPITDADTDLIVKWRNTPSVVQNFIFRQTFTPEMHRSWLATKVATGQVVQYIIVDKADGKPVGSVYYRDIDPHNRSAEYGIFIGEESARGKGLGTGLDRVLVSAESGGHHASIQEALPDEGEHWWAPCAIGRDGYAVALAIPKNEAPRPIIRHRLEIPFR